MDSNIFVEMCCPIRGPLSIPEKVDSSVKTCGHVLSSLNIDTLAVASFETCIPNLDSLKSKSGDILDIMYGKMRQFSGSYLLWQPYMKIFYFLE